MRSQKTAAQHILFFCCSFSMLFGSYLIHVWLCYVKIIMFTIKAISGDTRIVTDLDLY